MDVIYQDESIAVCIKPAGVPSQEGAGATVPALLRQALNCREIYTVHRLDTAAAGLMVYAKTQAAAAALSAQMAEKRFHKEYFALVHGAPAAPAGEYEDLLFKDAKKNKTYVVKSARRGVRAAKLAYRAAQTAQTPDGPVTPVKVTLFTGRTHQIRVQFASRGTPLLGDGKYGAKDRCKTLGLFSCRLAFAHPANGRPMDFFAAPPETGPWALFDRSVFTPDENADAF